MPSAADVQLVEISSKTNVSRPQLPSWGNDEVVNMNRGKRRLPQLGSWGLLAAPHIDAVGTPAGYYIFACQSYYCEGLDAIGTMASYYIFAFWARLLLVVVLKRKVRG